jgi:hypothetical protein
VVFVAGPAVGGVAWAVPLHAAVPRATAERAQAAITLLIMIKVSPPRSSLLLALIETSERRSG